MKYWISLIVIVWISGCTAPQGPTPNIILILADDIGFSDLGCYGGEASTPNLDYLGRNGMRFSTFYNMAKCNPTRSSMLTGLYKGGQGAVHIAHLTRESGYNTIMSGKEHFDDWVPEYCRAENVFDQSFTFWATTEYFLPPDGSFKRPFYLNGRELEASEIKHEQQPMYKTDFITDYAIDWLEDYSNDDKPFFLYLPYHAAHYPLQARPEDIARYRGKYKEGWDRLREKRFARAQSEGILPPNTKLSPPEGNFNQFRGPLLPAYTDYYPWDSLSAAQQDSLDLEMAVYAAMIDRMDQNIGRVLDWLREKGQLDNTLIFFLADNGACPFYANKIPDVPPGPAHSYWSMRSVWANLANTPFRQYKQCGHEGGSHTPFIAFWPDRIAPGQITHQPGHVVDIAPTFLDILQMEYPDTIQGFPTLPLAGKSLRPIFEGKERDMPEYFISGLEKFRMFRQDRHKIVRMNGGDWALYDMQEDPSELNDRSAQFPEKVKQLDSLYQAVEAGW